MKKNQLFLILCHFIFITETSFATICGNSDDRQTSSDSKIARMRNQGRTPETMSRNNNCTATLISTSCMITAKHCKTSAKYIEFNVPLSLEDGSMQPASQENIYEVIPDSIVGGPSLNEGEDWLIFKVKANQYSENLPGERFGFYEIESANIFDTNLTVEAKVTGFGVDENHFNRTQQTHSGPVTEWNYTNHSFRHQVDTKTGNSGSAIIETENQKIIGIHSAGGCNQEQSSQANLAVMIFNNQDLLEAIAKCINEE